MKRTVKNWRTMLPWLSLLFGALLALSLTACSSADTSADSDTDESSITQQSDSVEVSDSAEDEAESSPEELIEQVIVVAEQELGNEDGTKYEDALLDAGGELCYQRGYWCATFIWWVFREAGMSEYFCGGQMIVYPQQQAEYYESEGRYYETVNDDWQPECGDLIFFMYNAFPGGERISHSEIVLSYDEETRIVKTISANPVVAYHEHSIYDTAVIGFADLPYEDEATEEAA